MPDSSELIARIKGVKAEHHLAQDFRHEVANLLGRHQTSFPGAQPVSFASRHLSELRHQDYYVCEKTDGIRYLMYCTRDGDRDIHYLIDRKNDYYYIPNLHFPKQDDKTFASFHSETIFDGELVEDSYQDGHSELKFLVFDCLVLDGDLLTAKPLDKRLARFKEWVLKPYKELWKAYPEEVQHRPFAIEDKATQFSYSLEYMFKSIIPSVKQLHGNDGLIFTCKNTPYKTGTDEHILKWKPPAENTIDFVLHITWPLCSPDLTDPDRTPHSDYSSFPSSLDLFVYVGSDINYEYFASLYLTQQEWEDLKALQRPLQDSVVECYLEPAAQPPPEDNSSNKDENHTIQDDDSNHTKINTSPHPPRWRFHRLRDDKDHANHISTVRSVMESIEDHVTEQDLLDAAAGIRDAWKRRQAEEERGRKKK
jgi:mRNA guanylyltransferase